MLVPARAPDLVDALSEPALFLGSELPCLDSDACEENLEYSTELTQEEEAHGATIDAICGRDCFMQDIGRAGCLRARSSSLFNRP